MLVYKYNWATVNSDTYEYVYDYVALGPLCSRTLNTLLYSTIATKQKSENLEYENFI